MNCGSYVSKRLISFALFGHKEMYRAGAVENARLCARLYPGWTCRFYLSTEIDQRTEEEIRAVGGEVVRRERRSDFEGTFWRFEPAGEEGVEAVLFRDCDSRLNAREAAAVAEWLETGAALHVMRDHPEHHWPIMAGMWGMRPEVGWNMHREKLRWLRRKGGFGNGPFLIKEMDQHFLGEVVYRRYRHSAVIHSEYVRFRGENVRPFPTSRERGEFVGMPFDENGIFPARFALPPGGPSLETFPFPCLRRWRVVVAILSYWKRLAKKRAKRMLGRS